MTHVNVTIAGRSYRMACDDGQEEHLIGLGQVLDMKIEELRGSFGEIGDMRLAVMAGIMVADDLSETKRRVKTLEREMEGLRDARSAIQSRAEETEARVARAVMEAAQRIERVVDQLNPRTP